MGILGQDADLLEDTGQVLIAHYRESTQQPIRVAYIPCGIVGMKRRLQDAQTTVSSQKPQLTGFDMVTFDVTAPTVHEGYTALGILSQLGYIQDLTDNIANPKSNGYSYITFDLILNLE